MMQESGDEAPQKQVTSVNQEQIHDLIFSREIAWQEIIYDLINTEQLNPWNINLVTLTDKYLERIALLEEADFFVSSKVLLAAALLLRIKSEILLNKYIKSIDDILFGNKEEESSYKGLERIELDEEIPELVPRSPLPRFKKVTLHELMESLNKAISTENRRIKKEIINKNALRETAISMPKRTISIKDRISQIYEKIFGHLGDLQKHTVSFSDLVGAERQERIASFGPLLHLENQHKVWLHQHEHFDEIHIWLKKVYFKHNDDPFKILQDPDEDFSDSDWGEEYVEQALPDPENEEEVIEVDEERLKNLKNNFSDPLADETKE